MVPPAAARAVSLLASAASAFTRGGGTALLLRGGAAVAAAVAAQPNPASSVGVAFDEAGIPLLQSEAAGIGRPLADVARPASVIDDATFVEAAAIAGPAFVAELYTEVSTLLFHYARRTAAGDAIGGTAADTVVPALHRAAGLLELQFPWTGRDHHGVLLPLHRRVSKQLHQALFAVRPRRRTEDPSAGPQGAVNIVATIWGRQLGVAASATIHSLLLHSSVPLRVYIVGDREGWNAFSGAGFFDRLAGSSFVDPSSSASFHEFFRALPQNCSRRTWALTSEKNRFHLAARLFLHELLPAEVEQAVMLDVGDLIVFSDVRSLAGIFQTFGPEQVFAAAVEVGPAHLHYEAGPGAAAADVAAFWEHRGVPGMDKGLNTGVLLLDLARMRALGGDRGPSGSGKQRWADVLLAAARRMNDEYCGHEGNPDQSILSAVAFTFGSRFWAELSSRWNYIPGAPWDISLSNAASKELPEAVSSERLSPGLRPGGRFAHACPGYAELLGEWAFGPPEDETLEARLKVARRYHAWFHEEGALGFYTPDVQCGDEVHAVHFAGSAKSLPWARKLLKFWAAASAS